MHRLLICFLVLTTFCGAVFAQDLSSSKRPVRRYSPAPKPQTKPQDDVLFKKFLVNAGLHTEFYNQVQNDASGGLRKFDTAPVLGFGAVMPINPGFDFLPEFNWVLPRKSGEKILKNIFMLRGDLGYTPIDWFRLRFGTSIMWLNQHGSGGSAQVNNGNGTSTFYYPDENRSSFNSTLDLGAEFLLDNWAFRFQTYTYAAFKDERRQISYTLFVSYYWDR